MKLFLLIVLFSIFVIMGILIYKCYLLRFHLFSDLEFLCKYFKNNITFFKEEILTILISIKDKLHLSTIKIIKNIDKNNYLIKREDKEMISKFIYSLGGGDVDFEISNLTYYENYFSSMKSDSKEDIKNKGILYMKLMVIMGITLVILLI